ncbi:disks large homolog 5-like [Peromyscus maniculatus bairdii]|uniref:disks large homolog 5-like n=1 Tax=Peromyscus maniculatus bairdii TaxID=230844 RepID=UPI003FD212BC
MLSRLNRFVGRQDGEHRETKGRQKEDGLQSPCHTSRNKWFWGKHRTTRKASSNERNELLELLALYNNNELNNRLKSEIDMLKTQHKEMSDVKKFPKEVCEASYRCKKLSEQTNSYHTLYSQLLSEWTQLREKVSTLKENNRKLHGEQILLQESCEEARRLCEETHEKMYDLWTKQQQVV